MRSKKTKAKKCCQTNKEKLQERLQEYYRNLSKDGKIKKKIMLIIEIKTCQIKIEKEKNNI